MKTFHCTQCKSLVFFENTTCNQCQALLGYIPADQEICAFAGNDNNGWTPLPAPSGSRFRRCSNYSQEAVCNWMVPASDPNILCESCRLTRTIPTLSKPDNRFFWYRLEQAKRRLLYTLSAVGLPVEFATPHTVGPLMFDFLEDQSGADPIMTGHANGRIVINLKEADDIEREKTRAWAGEAYRTLLGHMRHESGHFYFAHLIEEAQRIESFRMRFGDERASYAESLSQHYTDGTASGEQRGFISDYASMHPLEDWAETWSHYLHMMDALDTANWCGLTLTPSNREDPHTTAQTPIESSSFESLLTRWQPLIYITNSLNRCLGLADAYPFSLSPEAVAKLQFVHDVIAETRRSQQAGA
ncbi:zinc-binding metallopeptidase family protein [Cupriavidus sp. Marseille-Q8015]